VKKVADILSDRHPVIICAKPVQPITGREAT
jgi:hypothetical protein